jgi:hypothetical protein
VSETKKTHAPSPHGYPPYDKRYHNKTTACGRLLSETKRVVTYPLEPTCRQCLYVLDAHAANLAGMTKVKREQP